MATPASKQGCRRVHLPGGLQSRGPPEEEGRRGVRTLMARAIPARLTVPLPLLQPGLDHSGPPETHKFTTSCNHTLRRFRDNADIGNRNRVLKLHAVHEILERESQGHQVRFDEEWG